MNISNRKGLEIAIGTVAMIAIVLAVLLVVAGYFLRGMEETGGGLQDVATETGNETGSFRVGDALKRAIAGGECTGGDTTIDCSNYAKMNTPDALSYIPVTSCGNIGCVSDSDENGLCKDGGEPFTDCSQLSNEQDCEIVGCGWATS